MELLQNNKMARVVTMLLFAVVLYVSGQFINGLREYSTIGRVLQSPATINVSGTGEAVAIPDVANISFSVAKDAKTVADAQKQSAEKINAIMAFLKENDIDSLLADAVNQVRMIRFGGARPLIGTSFLISTF